MNNLLFIQTARWSFRNCKQFRKDRQIYAWICQTIKGIRLLFMEVLSICHGKLNFRLLHSTLLFFKRGFKKILGEFFIKNSPKIFKKRL